MSLSRNDIKTEIYTLLSRGAITGEQANQIFEKSYEGQQEDTDLLTGVTDTAADWVQQKIIELGF